MGCGNSEGTFDYNQTVQNSADEVIAAIKTLRKKRIPGAKKIGLWGISRGGWINPLVIKKYKKIEFWISVSGVDEKENFKYLLAENLRINGYPKDSIDLLVGEWQAGTLIAHRGGSFEEYEAATRNLWQNKFLLRFNNGVRPSKANYDAGLAAFMEQSLDEATGLPVYIPNFERVLSKVKCPVLALFGEMDMNVDWTKTKALYQRTLGKNTDLSIRSFPNCNHNLIKCETGGFYEIQDNNLGWNRCDGFLEAMAEWLEQR